MTSGLAVGVFLLGYSTAPLGKTSIHLYVRGSEVITMVTEGYKYSSVTVCSSAAHYLAPVGAGFTCLPGALRFGPFRDADGDGDDDDGGRSDGSDGGDDDDDIGDGDADDDGGDAYDDGDGGEGDYDGDDDDDDDDDDDGVVVMLMMVMVVVVRVMLLLLMMMLMLMVKVVMMMVKTVGLPLSAVSTLRAAGEWHVEGVLRGHAGRASFPHGLQVGIH